MEQPMLREQSNLLKGYEVVDETCLEETEDLSSNKGSFCKDGLDTIEEEKQASEGFQTFED